jgi:FAD/FMN-containing dehydrogenase
VHSSRIECSAVRCSISSTDKEKCEVASQELLTPDQLADLCQVPLATVYAWNYRGTGPRLLKVGRHARYRRSDVYRKLVALDRRHGLSAILNARRGAPQHEDVIQDVEIPVQRGAEFLRTFAAGVGMTPVWMCPLRLSSDRGWPLYPLEPGRAYVNFGFWGTVPLPPGESGGYYNRLVEDTVTGLGGHKGLYSTSFYAEEEFWSLYQVMTRY